MSSVTSSIPSSVDDIQEDVVMILHGQEHDPIIPSAKAIHYTYYKQARIWSQYAYVAESSHLSDLTLDARSVLYGVPALPSDLYKRDKISGQSVWEVPCPELDEVATEVQEHGSDWRTEHIRGIPKTLYLSVSERTQCTLSQAPSFHDLFLDENLPAHTNGLAVLIFCWSYIFSARLMEMQKRHIFYPPAAILPIQDRSNNDSDAVNLDLTGASRSLVRWLCALLTTDEGWMVDGRLPPWATSYQGSPNFKIQTSYTTAQLSNENPPSSKEAGALLIELCSHFYLGTQPKAAFLATLLLPLHNSMDLQPQFPKPLFPSRSIGRPHNGYEHSVLTCIYGYIDEISYYMTLSLCPESLGSALWSIWWEPGMDSSLVSASFAAIYQTLQPYFESHNLEMLIKIFAIRRPETAPFWIGMGINGCAELIHLMKSWLKRLDLPRPFFSRPDSDVALWIGFPQSFLDEDIVSSPQTFPDENDTSGMVTRSDLFRLRNNFRPFPLLPKFPWQPPGKVSQKEVEVELWSRLRVKSQPRKYLYWQWSLCSVLGTGATGGDADAMKKAHIDKGFRRDEPFYKSHSIDTDSRIAAIPKSSKAPSDILLEPSKAATAYILEWGAQTVSGDCDLSATLKNHPWLVDLRLGDDSDVENSRGQEQQDKEKSQQTNSRIHQWLEM